MKDDYQNHQNLKQWKPKCWWNGGNEEGDIYFGRHLEVCHNIICTIFVILHSTKYPYYTSIIHSILKELVLIAYLTQCRIFWEEGLSEGLYRRRWSVDMSVANHLDYGNEAGDLPTVSDTIP